MLSQSLPAQVHTRASLFRRGFRLVPYETLAATFAGLADRCAADGTLHRRNSLVTEFQVADAASDAEAFAEIQDILLLAKIVADKTDQAGAKLRVQARLCKPRRLPLYCDDHDACEDTSWKVHCALAHRDNLKPQLLIRSDGALRFAPFNGRPIAEDAGLNNLKFYLSRRRRLQGFGY